jgi:ATP-binding cassette, subfamily C (CFTR/MRP), member 4
MKDGKIEQQGKPEDLKNSGVDLDMVMKMAEETENIRRRSMSRSSSRSSVSDKDEEEEPAEPENEKQHNEEEISKGKVKGNVTLNYLSAGGNKFKLFIAGFLFVLTQAIATTSDYWIGFWTQTEEERFRIMQSNTTDSNGDEDNGTLLPSDTLIYVGGFLIASLFFIAIIRSIFFYTITIGASRTLHATAFNGVIETKMKFFDLNPSGRILNRFSKDLGSIDEWLPKCLLDSTQVILMALGSIVITGQ